MGGTTARDETTNVSQSDAAPPSRVPSSPQFGPQFGPYASIPVSPPRPRIQSGRGLALGFAVALFGGLIWGLIAAASGYIFVLVAIAVGYGIAWAIAKGAGGVTGGLIVAAIVLTMFSVFVGEIVTLSIIASQYGVAPSDVIGAYPQIVAEFPGDTIPSYVFGLIGAGLGAYGLYQQGRSTRIPMPYPGFAPSLPPIAPPGPTVADSATVGAQVRIAHRSTYDVTLEVAFPPKPSVVRAFYTTMTGRAEVHLDGQLAQKTRVWGMKKEVSVQLGDTGQSLVVRFLGAVSPRIEMHLDGRFVAAA